MCSSDLEVRRQADAEREHYVNEVQRREAEIQRLHLVMQQADRNAYEAENSARVAAEELAPAQQMNSGTAPRVATPPPQFAGSPRLPSNASPRRSTDLRPPTDVGGEGPGYDREEDFLREELAREGGTPAKQRRRGVGAYSNASSLRNSPMIAAHPQEEDKEQVEECPGIKASGGLGMIIIIIGQGIRLDPHHKVTR